MYGVPSIVLKPKKVMMESAGHERYKQEYAGYLRVMAFCLFSQGFSIMMAQFRSFFWGEIGFLRCMKVFFHLFYDMFSFKIMFNFQVSRCFDNLMSVSADRTELPFLETIHVRESPA